MQVSVFSIVFMAISAGISIGLPVAFFIFLFKKYNAKFLPMIFGAAAFFIFALVLEQLIHSVVFKNFALKEKPLIYIIYGTLMAGIFEETARFISFNILKKKNHKGIITGLSYGIGHGGTEAVLIAGLAMIASIVFCIMINTGNAELITGKLQGGALETMSALIDTLKTTAPYMFLISGIERTFAIIIQVSLSVIVFYSVFNKGKIWLYPLAIILHAVIDIPAAVFQVKIIENVLVIEGIICLSAAALAALAVILHKKQKDAS